MELIGVTIDTFFMLARFKVGFLGKTEDQKMCLKFGILAFIQRLLTIKVYLSAQWAKI